MKYSAVFYLFTIILLLNSNLSFSQSSYNLLGTAVDKQDSVLGINAILLNPTDTTFIKGDFFSEGHFTFSNLLTNTILLKITAYGYEDTILFVENQVFKSIDLGEIVLKELSQEIGEITIKASIPLFEKSDDGALIVNVQKTMLGSSTSVLEILSKSPNVVISGGLVSVIGRGEAILYLNGKRITFEQLGGISVQSVQKVEIISNPSSKYDAEGRAVINIILKSNPREGFEVNIVQNVIFARHFLYAPTLTLNYRKGKFSIYGNYGLTLGKDWNKGTVNRNIETSSGLYSSTKVTEENTKSTYVGNHSLGAAYQFNQNHSISAEYSGLYNLYDLDVESDNSIANAGISNTNLRTKNHGNSTNVNNAFSLNYNGNLDTLGSTIFVGGMSSKYRNNLFDLIDENILQMGSLINEAERKNIGENNIALNTFQIDISKFFLNKINFDFGAKYGDAINNSKIDFYSKNEGEEFVLIQLYSNDFTYHEKIPAAYLHFKGAIGKKINYSVGARSEYSMITGYSAILNKNVIDTNYFNLFPNMVINYKYNDTWSYVLSYSSRISRPMYQDLDPYLWYQDSLTSIMGNPFIKPELINGGEVSIERKSVSLKAGYFYSKDPSKFVTIPGNTGDGSVIMRKINLQAKHSFATTLSVPLTYKSYSSYNSISLTLNKLVDNRTEFVVGVITPQFYLYSFNQLKVKKWFNLEAIFDYEGAKSDGIFQDNQSYSLAIGLSKYMLDSRLTLRFLANDALRTYRVTGSSSIGQVKSTYDARFNTVFYRFSVIYYFGKLKEVNYNNKSTGSDEFDRLKL